MTQLDFDQARYNMVEQQVRPWEVLDQRVLDVLARVPREDFVPERYRGVAFADLAIPIGCGQTMMRPVIEGRLLQALELGPADQVLEVGTGSGFITACLAQLAAHVSSVEIHEELKFGAQQRLRALGLGNVRLRTGDGAHGWETEQTFDAIALTGSLAEIPQNYKRQLKIGGRLFVVVGDSPVMEALLITRTGERQWLTESLFETDLPRLVHGDAEPRFVL